MRMWVLIQKEKSAVEVSNTYTVQTRIRAYSIFLCLSFIDVF